MNTQHAKGLNLLSWMLGLIVLVITLVLRALNIRSPVILVGLLVGLTGIMIPSVLKAQDCAPLDPRQQMSERTTQDIAGAAQTVFKVGSLKGSYRGVTEKEVKNLYDKYPGADKIVVKDKLIYLFCTTLKESNLSSDSKLREFHNFISEIQDIGGKGREYPSYQGGPKNQSNRAMQSGYGNELNQQNRGNQTGDGNQQNEINQGGSYNRAIQGNQ